MSIHLLECAANLPLPPSTKLALMAFADSADRYTHIAFPGLEQVMKWAGVGRSRAAEIVSELVEEGHLHKHRGGHRGRRAEYVVFPFGCCSEHPRDTDVPEGRETPGSGRNGSGGPDSLSVNGSGGPDPIGSSYPNGSAAPEAFTEKGSGKGPVGRTPSPTTTTSPLPPAGVTEPQLRVVADDDTPPVDCPKHRNQPAPGCRGCGTTPRQVEAKRRRAAAKENRDRLLAEQAARRRAAAERAELDPAVRESVRQQIQAAKTRSAQ